MLFLLLWAFRQHEVGLNPLQCFEVLLVVTHVEAKPPFFEGRRVCFSALSIKTTKHQKAVKGLGLENLERGKERALPLLQLILLTKHDPKTTQRDREKERDSFIHCIL